MDNIKETGPMRVGVSIIRQLSTAFYTDTGKVFEELVSNAYDAGATRVDVCLSDKEISIKDNGAGMSPEELMRFFYISHTDKVENKKYNHLSTLKRQIIGKFGIGKLSMYRLCNQFSVTSWKNGVESCSEFSFEDFEKLAFVDELTLSVKKEKTNRENTGTHLLLRSLKPHRTVKDTIIRRHLSKTMPLRPDFRLYVNNIPCAPIKRIGTEYCVEGDVKNFGRVTGRIIYTGDALQERDSGIYVRVHGRVVNRNPRLIELGDLRSALSLSRRTYMEIDADWLWDVVKADRSGFIEDNEKYEALLEWLTTTLNKYNHIEGQRRNKEKKSDETEKAFESLKERLSLIGSKNPDPSSKTKMTTARTEKKDSSDEGLARVQFNNRDFRVILSTGNTEMPAWSTSKDLVLLNSAHPLYIEAEERGCLDFYILHITIQAIAREVSKNMNEEQINYEKLAREVCKRS